MKNIAIKVENLSKRYRIGLKEEVKDTFISALGSILTSPFGNLKKLKKLTKFEDENSDGDIIWALKDVSFEVKKGEVVGIIGANGAGKSTLLKILAKITHPSSGRIELIGRIASLLEVGTGFHPELTGRENIYLNGTILGMTKKEIDIKLDEIIEFSGVEKFIDTVVKKYSSGMRVRLAFSVAAHLDPEILLIDEVLAVGDAEFQKKCLGKMDDISKQGRTILFVSHNLNAIRKICNRSILVRNGFIEYIGNSEKVISRYLTNSFDSLGIIEWDDKSQKLYNENNFAYFKSLRLYDIYDKTKSIFSRQESIKIEFIYVLTNNISNYFEVNLILLNDRAEIVFYTPIPQLYLEEKFSKKGTYQANYEVQKLLLNDGDYIIELEFIIGVNRVIKKESALVFKVIDDNEDKGIRRKYRTGKQWPQSVIRPELNCKLNILR